MINRSFLLFQLFLQELLIEKSNPTTVSHVKGYVHYHKLEKWVLICVIPKNKKKDLLRTEISFKKNSCTLEKETFKTNGSAAEIYFNQNPRKISLTCRNSRPLFSLNIITSTYTRL